MTKQTIPFRDTSSPQIIHPSHFERYIGDFIPDHVVSGFTLSNGGGLNLAVAVGDAWVKGTLCRVTVAENVAMNDNQTNHVYIQKTRDGISEVNGWQFTVNTTGTPPSDSFKLATVTTSGGAITLITDVRQFRSDVKAIGLAKLSGAPSDSPDKDFSALFVEGGVGNSNVLYLKIKKNNSVFKIPISIAYPFGGSADLGCMDVNGLPRLFTFANGNATSASASGSGSASATSTGFNLSTGTTINSEAEIQDFELNRDKFFVLHLIWRTDNFVATQQWEIGVTEKSNLGFSGNNENFAVFLLDTTVSANLYVRTNDGGASAPAAVDTGVVVAINTKYLLTIVNDPDDATPNMKFYVNGVLKHTATTDLPTGTAVMNVRGYAKTLTSDSLDVSAEKIQAFGDAM